MAEALPRYRKAGVLLADIPRIDFAGTRESARSSAMLADRLDQLSNWAFGEAVKKAEDEGLQYGAENPVTVKQIADGTAFFQPKDTVFGRSARAAQVASIVSDIELESHQKLNMLKVGVERGEVDLGAARTEIQALLDGGGKALAQIDPKASLKLRASLGTTANSAYLAMTQAYLKRQDETRKVAVDQWLDGAVAEQVRAHVQAGDTVDPQTGQVVTAQQRIDGTLKSTLNTQLASIGDDVFARQARTKYEKIVSDARVDALVRVANDPAFAKDRNGKFDPVAAVARVDRGDFGGYTSLFRAMPSEEQAKVRTALRQAAADRFTADQHVQQEQKHADTLKVNGLVPEYMAANPARSRQIIAELNRIATTSGAISGEAINSLIKSRKDGSGEGSKDATEAAEFRLRTEVLNGQIRTPEELWRRASQYGAKPKQANEVLGFFVNRQNRGETEADRKLRSAAGLAPGVINPAAHKAEAYINLTRQLDEQFNKASEAHRTDPAKNPAPDREAIADALVKKRQESPHVKAIENTLKSLNDAYGPTGVTKKTGVTFTEDTTPDDAERALKAAGVAEALRRKVVDDLRSIEARRRQLNALRP